MSEPLWTSDEVLAAVRGRLEGEGFAASGINFDTRGLEPGDLFVALQGERDGHDFVAQAFAKGAAAALVARPVEGGPAVVVPDTLKALEALAAYARERAPLARRGAVTGSVGKTSVTQAVLAGLKLAGEAHGSIKSFNNHIGVPLTLARMPKSARRAVFEIGMNHAGEIGPLSRLVQPHAACITNVGPVHTEAFEDGEAGVARAKAEIFEGIAHGGTAVLNADNPWFEVLKAAAVSAGARVRSFGSAETADARLLDYQPDVSGGARVSARIDGHDYVFHLAQTGFHWGLNGLAVLLMLEALDVPLDTGFSALESFAPLEGRGRERNVRIEGGEFLLVDESYNANPLSMKAALASLAARRLCDEGRRIVVLTDMLELGRESERHHADLAEAIEAADVHRVYLAGPHMKALWDVLPETRRAAWAETAADLIPAARDGVRPGDVVMVKGSNGSKASLVAAALASLDLGAREDA
jgi:UDP-N-acetylmuramoyl-tripeptide--D-alanyl-D-alanine ligase